MAYLTVMQVLGFIACPPPARCDRPGAGQAINDFLASIRILIDTDAAFD